MNDVILKNSTVVLNVLKCQENEKAIEPLLKNRKILVKASVSIKWMTKQDILHQKLAITSKPRQVFVVPHFDDGKVFNYLRIAHQSIWGPAVVSYCISKLELLPDTPLILHSMTFYGITVSFTGLGSKEKGIQGKKIELMGGKVSPEFSMRVDILIGTNCEPTSKYQAACSWKKPLCSVEMIDALWKESLVHVTDRVDKFSIKLFTDCVIAVSGFEADEREIIKQEIEGNGGKYVVDMEQNICTHLITDKIGGEKYSFAIKWGIRIVMKDWLNESLIQKCRLSEELYHTDPSCRKDKSESLSSSIPTRLKPINSQKITSCTGKLIDSENSFMTSNGDRLRKFSGSSEVGSANKSTLLDLPTKDMPNNKSEKKKRSVTFSDSVSVCYYETLQNPLQKVQRKLISEIGDDELMIKGPNNGSNRPNSARSSSFKLNKSCRSSGPRSRKGKSA